MRKYAIAGLGAIAAFSTSAFAASLALDAGTLQVGQDSSVTCTNGYAKTTYKTNRDETKSWVDKVYVTFPDGSCDGMFVVLTGKNAAGGPALFDANGKVSEDTATFDIPDGRARTPRPWAASWSSFATRSPATRSPGTASRVVADRRRTSGGLRL